MNALNDKIRKIALEVAPDYPQIETCDEFECLYAIHSSYQGTHAANEDLHLILKVLMKRYNIEIKELLDISDKVRELKGSVMLRSNLTDDQIVEKIA